jgi:excisionase family DNA binding protein
MKTLYSAQEAIRYLGTSQGTFYKWLNDESMPLYGEIVTNSRIFRREELDAFIAFREANPDRFGSGRRSRAQKAGE